MLNIKLYIFVYKKSSQFTCTIKLIIIIIIARILPSRRSILSPINDELNTNPIDNIRTKCLLKQHKQQHLFPCRTLITSNPHDVRFNSLFLFTQINSLIVHLKSVRAHSFANAPGLSEPRTNEKLFDQRRFFFFHSRSHCPSSRSRFGNL